MYLYIVCDTKNKTVTAPAIAPTLEEAQNALNTINPENISDLIIHPLVHLQQLSDLFLLSIDETKILPDFLFNRSAEVTPSATHQGEAAVVYPHE